MRKLSLLLMLCCLSFAGMAQTAASYTLTSFTAAGDPVPDTTNIFGLNGDNLTMTGVPIGFGFNYCGVIYDNMSVCSNGWISFINSSSTVATNTQTAMPGTGTAVLMPFWDDLNGSLAGPVRVATSGSSPNRICQVEWSGWGINSPASGNGTVRVVLHETTNVIEFFYKGFPAFTGASATIGIANGPVDFRTLTNVGATLTSSTSTFTTNISTSPSSAQWYRFTPPSSAPPITGTLQICAGSTTNLSTTATGGSWISGSTSIATVNTTGIVTGVAAGTATISYITATTTSTAVVSVNAIPTITGSGNICVGSSVTLGATPGGVWSTTSSNITVSGSGVVTGVAAGSAFVTYTLTTGCQATAPITVFPIPTISGTATLAVGSTTTLSATGGTGSWSSSIVANATVNAGTGLVTGIAPGTSSIIYTLSATGCSASRIVTVSPSANDRGLNFDGENDYVSVAGGLPGTASNVTYEAWIKPELLDGNFHSIINNDAFSSGQIHFQFNPSNALEFAVAGANPANQVSSFTFAANTWYHVAVVYSASGNALKIYVNGTLTDNLTYISTVPVASAQAYAIGGWYHGFIDRPFKGTIDEVRIWDAARSAGQIAAAMNCDIPQNTNLKAYYRFNQGTAGGTNTSISTASDFSGVGNCGILNNFTLTGAASNFVTGAIGTCDATANSNVNAGTISGGTSVTVSGTLSLTENISGGVWSISNSNATINTSGVVTGVAVGTTTVTYTVTNTCGTAFAIKTLNVLPGLTAITGTTSVCYGSTTTLSNSAPGGSWGSNTPSVATVNSTGVVTGLANGTSVISYVVGSSFVTTVVTVYPLPAPITGTLNVCEGSTTTLSDVTGGGTWSSTTPGVAGISPSGVVSGITAGSTTVYYTLPTTCRTSAIVYVNALPAASTGPTAVCEGSFITLSNSTPGGLSWTSDNTEIATINPSGVITGISAGTTFITYTLSTGCITVTQITVNALPTAISGTTNYCVGGSATLSSSPSGGTWTSGSTAVAVIDPSTGFVSTGAAGTATITYTLPTGCKNTVIITVNPVPTAITGTTSLCAGTSVTLSNAVTGGSWSSNNTTVATVGAGNGIVTGTGTGSATITYSLAAGCYATTVVNVTSALPAIVDGGLHCVGIPATLTNPATGGTWSSSNTSIVTIVPTTGVSTGVVPGSATITYTFTPGCKSMITIVISPTPAAITGTSTVCAGLTTTYSTTTTGGSWISSNTAKATVNSSGVITGVAAGTSTISYVMPTGCYVTKVVTVNPLPAAIAGATSVCVGSITSLTDPTTGGLSWTSSNTGIATINSSGVVTGVTAGSVMITYTLTTGCYTTTPFVVNPLPAAIGGAPYVCIGSTSALSNTVTGGTWISGSTGVASVGVTTGVVSGLSAGTAIITYTLTSGCRTFLTVTVGSLPSAITGPTSVCAGSTITLSDLTPGGSWSSNSPTVASVSASGVVTGLATGSATITYSVGTGCYTTYNITVTGAISPITGTTALCLGVSATLSNATLGGTWSSSNGAVASITTTGVVSGIIAGTTNITYAVTSGCRSVVTLTVNAAVPAISGSSTVCLGSSTPFTIAATGGTWSSSNPVIATVTSGGSVTGMAVASTIITYYVNTGCYATKNITVVPLPGAITGTTSVCVGGTTVLSNPTTGGTSWTSGNTAVATINSSGTVTGISAGTSVITYTISTGCTATTVVTVYALPAAITGNMNVCAGGTTLLSDVTTGGTWSVDNASVATISGTGLVSGVAAGTTTVSYSSNAGCLATATVTVIALPATISGASSVCIGSIVPFTDATSGGTWISNSPTVASVNSSTGVVTGLAAGSATISYIMPSGCYSTAFITIAPLSSILGTTSACIGGTTTLTHAVSGGTWSSSNSDVATVGLGTGIVSGITAGTATITYTVSTGCFKTVVVTINNLPDPITGATSVCVGSTTALSNSVTGGTWSSSSPTIATISGSGVVTGVNAGSANITYTLPTGCIAVQAIVVNANPSAITGNTSLCVSTSTTLNSSSTGVSWTSSNIGVANVTVVSGIVTGNSIGTATITMTMSTGCYSTTTVTVNALPSPISGSTIICAGSSTTMSATPTGGTWSSLPTTAATISSTGVVTGVAMGTATISYAIGSGCVSSTIITINPVPVAITGAPVVCVGSSTPIATLTTGGVWASSTPTVAAITSGGVVTGLATGSATMYYTLSTGCSSAFFMTVNSAVPAITGVGTTCLGLTTTLANTATGGSWSSSNTGIASVSSTGVVTGNGAGTVTITYSLSTGCISTTIVTVNAGPSAITGTMIVCANGGTTALSSTSAGGTWTSNNTGIASIGLTSGVVTGVNAGTVTITYAIGGSCRTFATVTVNPVPNFIAGPGNVCVGSTALYTNTTSGGAWTSSSPTIAPISGSGLLTALATGTTTISYTLSTGCARGTVVTVAATPAAITGTAAVCEGATTNLTHPSFGGTWSSSNTAVASVELTSGVVTGVAAGNATITYTISTGCIAVTTVTVNPLPADITGASITCVGSSTTLSTASTGGTWSSNNVSIASVVPATGVVTGVAAGITTITYTLPTGCRTTRIMTVNTTPSAITGVTSLCVGATTVLVNTTPGGILWSSSNPAIASIGSASGVVTGNAIGTATITYHINTGCMSTTTVSVNTAPGAITGTTLLCNGDISTLSAIPTGGTWSSSNNSVAVIGATGIVTAVNAGTSIITYSTGAGCTSIALVSVNPVPNPISGASTICLGQTATLTNTTPGGSWTSSNAGVASVGSMTGVVSSVTAGTATITYSLATGCKVTYPVSVTVSLSAISGASTTCIGLSTTFSNTTAGGSWSSSNISIATVGSLTGIVTGTNAGTATITYAIGSGCTATKIITISASPAQITGASTVCAGNTTPLFNTDAGGTWTSSNTSVATIGSSTGIVNGITAGTSIITYSLSAGCRDLAIITVNPIPAAITGATTMCAGSVTTLSSATTGGVWSSGNTLVATVSPAGLVTAVATGTANITYTLSTGCMRSITVTVAATPAAITGTPVVCAGLTTILGHPSAGGTWSSSNTAIATVGTAGVVTGVAAGNATITYTITSGCMAVAAVTVNPVPSAISGTPSTCIGSSTTLASSPAGGVWTSGTPAVATVNVSTGIVTGVTTGTTAISYTLTSGCAAKITVTVNNAPSPISGTTSLCAGGVTVLTNSPIGISWTSSNTAVATIGASSGVLTGVSSGTTTISYLYSSGCVSTTEVTVHATPSAITGGTTICAGNTSALVSSPSGGTWTSSSTSVASVDAAGIVTAIAAGTSRITYNTGVGCNVVAVVSVSPIPGAITGSTTICLGLTSALSSTPAGGIWSSGDGSVATVSGTGVVSSVSLGTANITYTSATTGCIRTTMVTVAPSLAANTGTATTCIGLTTTLANVTTGGTWSSSNTAVATVGTGGTVTGMTAGTATITYGIGSGCNATTVVTVNGAPAAIGGTLSVCAGSTTVLTNTDAGGTWTSSNATVATIGAATGIVSGNVMGTSIITYSLSAGCRKLAIVTVNPLPAAITGATTMCVGSVATLASTTTGGVWSSSNTGVATISGTGLVTALSTGTTAITYALATGCQQIAIVTVSGAATAITGTPEVCVGATTTLSNTTTGGTWTSSSAGIATVGADTGVVMGVAAGNATITYYTAAGCMATQNVTVNPNPSTITGTASTCVGSTTTLSSTPSGGIWSSTNSSIADVNAITGVVSGISGGTTTISYMIGIGCYKTVNVAVNATPAPISGTTSMCVGAVTALTSTPTGISWTSSNTSVATIGVSSGIVTATGIGTTTITYLFSTGCTSTTVVTVNSAPAPISGITTVCAGSTSALASAPSGGTWTSTTPAVASINATTGMLTAIAAGVTNITYSTGVGCTSTASVVVNPLPAVITGTSTVCPGTSVTLSDATSGGVWSSDNGTVASVSGSGVLTGVSTGATTISYTLATGCARTIAVNVTSGLSAITGTLTTCIGLSTTLADATTGGTWSSSNTTKATVNATTGVVTGIAGGTTTITYASGAGCYTTAVVTVITSPAAITGTLGICVGGNSTLSSTDAGGTWTSSNSVVAPIVAATGVVTASSAGTAIITYSLSGGCRALAMVTVNALPSTITGVTTICTGSTVTLSSGPATGVWSSSAPAVATVGTSGLLTGVTAGAATISYTLATGCFRTASVTVNNLGPISGNLNACVSQVTTLTNATSGGVWTSSAATIATVSAGNVTGVNPGTARITYTIATGCYVIAPVTVNTLPAVITGAASVCVNATTTLASATTGGVWSSSNAGLGIVNPSTGDVTGISAGTPTISYTDVNGCYRTKSIAVRALPVAIAGNAPICVGGHIIVTDATPTGVSWTSNNTSVATIGISSGLITGVSGGNATITYLANSGCYTTAVVTVDATPNAGVISGPATVSIIASPILFTNTATGGLWASSNSSVATVGAGTGLVTGVSAGAVTISYVVSNACGTAVATAPITITSPRAGGNVNTQGEQATSTTVSLYPNPTSGTFTVTATGTGTFAIFTLEGKTVYTYTVAEGANTLNMPAGLANGVYMCRYTGDNGSAVMVRLVYEQ